MAQMISFNASSGKFPTELTIQTAFIWLVFLLHPQAMLNPPPTALLNLYAILLRLILCADVIDSCSVLYCWYTSIALGFSRHTRMYALPVRFFCHSHVKEHNYTAKNLQHKCFWYLFTNQCTEQLKKVKSTVALVNVKSLPLNIGRLLSFLI